MPPDSRQGGTVLKEFKEFISQGDVVALAVAVVIAGAFLNVVTSFVDDILLQIVAAIGGEPDFSALSFGLNGADIRYGNFLTVLAAFIIVAFAVFLVVKLINAVRTPEEEDDGPSEIDLLTDIRDAVRR